MKDKSYRIFTMDGVKYVLTQSRNGEDQANFMGTGMALAGITKSNDLQEFTEKQSQITMKNLAHNESLTKVHGQLEYRQRVRAQFKSGGFVESNSN